VLILGDIDTGLLETIVEISKVVIAHLLAFCEIVKVVGCNLILSHFANHSRLWSSMTGGGWV
jgi:hypothetical protein